MAGNGRRGGGDRVLESRHLVGLFLGVVLLCGVFFTLGYVMGKTQYGGPVHAADSLEKIAPAIRNAVKPKDAETSPSPAAPANSEWDFYAKSNNNHIDPAMKTSAPAAAPAPAVSTATAKTSSPAPVASAKSVPVSARFQAPKMGKGSVVLQISALTHESDALAMADVLQQKHFPSFVVTPSNDSFYRVQVGPYPDEKAAESARNALDRAGFKAIIKR
ncbi:MAG TPA: SPOR domain-containing protein [Candidatus Acidoferrales bacterium]|nr:SPOR domain-containing protein [Candidatus Acidoferrales bacterium]